MADNNVVTFEKLPAKPSRVSLDLTPAQFAKLERLALKAGKTKADLLRFALDVLSAASEHQEQGYEVGAFRDNPDKGVRQEKPYLGIP